jgi:hypothetical protein
MGVLGKFTKGTAQLAVVADKKYASSFVLSERAKLGWLEAYLHEGSGAYGATQEMAAVIYAHSGGNPAARLAQSLVVEVERGLLNRFIRFPLLDDVTLEPGTYWLGVHAGPGANVASLSYAATGAAQHDTDTFADGASDPWALPSDLTPTQTLAIYTDYQAVQVTRFDPDAWMTSTIRAFEEYIKTGLNQSWYDVRFSYPPADFVRDRVPLAKTLIHFEIEDMPETKLGFGEGVVNQRYDPVAQTVEKWHATPQEVRLSVGIWSSAESGGETTRMEAREDLSKLLSGPVAKGKMMEATDGVELLSFTGGRNLTDTINDSTVWRMVDMEVRLRVYQRTKAPVVGSIEQVEQEPGVEIDESVIIG